MPLISTSTYEPPLLPFCSGHLQTIYQALLRRVPDVAFRRERIETPDHDFLDLDWLTGNGPARLAILSHGLEGNTEANYIRGMARALYRRGWDVLAWNFRGCSGEPNRQLCFYHSGATGDLDVVVRHALDRRGYESVSLIGFSLGGNLALKYIGERGDALDPRIRRAVAFSVPCNLAAGSAHMARLINWVYMRYFLTSLRRKVVAKMQSYPDRLDATDFWRIHTFRAFDDRYTAPLHGFRDAEDYWRQSSSRPFIPGIRRPTLLVNAADDPFLPAACYPFAEARTHAQVFLEVPDYGGHVGFVSINEHGEYWSEQRAAAFLAVQTDPASPPA